MNDAIKLAIEALEIAKSSHGVTLTSYPAQDAWVYHGVAGKIEAAIAALRAQPESVCPECHCHFTANEVTAPGSTRLVNTAQPEVLRPDAMIVMVAQPDQIVDANEMVDHSELVNRLRSFDFGANDTDEWIAIMDEAADALEGKTK